VSGDPVLELIVVRKDLNWVGIPVRCKSVLSPRSSSTPSPLILAEGPIELPNALFPELPYTTPIDLYVDFD